MALPLPVDAVPVVVLYSILRLPRCLLPGLPFDIWQALSFWQLFELPHVLDHFGDGAEAGGR